MQKIIIPISEFDVEMFRNLVKGKLEGGETMTWQFPTNKGEEIEIEFIKGEE